MNTRWSLERPWIRNLLSVLTLIFAVASMACATTQTNDPLPSWNDGTSRQAIIQFVKDVTSADGLLFVPPAERIAVFDNDGTLWVEYPMYTQVLFAFDRVKTLAPQHPEWKTKQPFKAPLEGDMKTVGAAGMRGLMEIIMAITATEFEKTVLSWLSAHKQPKFNRLYTESVYQPQLELLAYLRALTDVTRVERSKRGRTIARDGGVGREKMQSSSLS